jgi:O-antigen ligase
MRVLFPAHERVSLILTAVWTFCGVAIYLMAPKTAPGILLLSLVAPVVWLRGRTSEIAGSGTPSAVTVLMAIAGLYLTINATWSLVPGETYRSLVTMLVVVACLYIVPGALQRIDASAVSAMALGLCVAFVTAGVVLAFDVAAGQPIHQHILRAFPMLTTGARGVEDTSAVDLPLYFLNANMAALIVLFWPTVLSARWLSGGRGSSAAQFSPIIPAAIAIFLSEHATSQIALLGGVAVFFAQAVTPRAALPLVAAGWITACLAVVPIGHLAYAMHFQVAPWLPASAHHRIVIWKATSQLVAKAPFLGSGLASARALAHTSAGYAPGTEYALSTSVHSHNAYLQVWFETGLVGAVLLLAIGLVVLRWIARAEAGARPALLATFASCALVAASSFSIWAPWFIASFALAALFAMPAYRLVDDEAPSNGR